MPHPSGGGGKESEASDELIGELAHKVSLLIRSDVELSAVNRGPALREVASELALAVLAGLVFLLALAAISWAGILGLANLMRREVAALLVAAWWAASSALLLRYGPPHRLWLRLTRETHEQRLLSAQRDRGDAEHAVRETAARLGAAVMHETGERELRAATSAAERVGAAAEDEVEALLRELRRALNVPARAGKTLLDMLRGPSEEEAGNDVP
jgi:Putative Actinobacterial Holin-X, holin superfamily III